MFQRKTVARTIRDSWERAQLEKHYSLRPGRLLLIIPGREQETEQPRGGCPYKCDCVGKILLLIWAFIW